MPSNAFLVTDADWTDLGLTPVQVENASTTGLIVVEADAKPGIAGKGFMVGKGKPEQTFMAPGCRAWGRSQGEPITVIASPIAAGGAIAAGEQHIGFVGGSTAVVVATPPVSAGSYTSGQVLGGKVGLTGLARLPGGTGIIQQCTIWMRVASLVPIDLLLFHSDPSGSTFADRQPVNVAAADFDKLIGVAHVTDWTSIGPATSIGQSLATGVAFKLPSASADAFVVPVARGAITIVSAGDLKLAVKSLRD